jgi:hypothetical protein
MPYKFASAALAIVLTTSAVTAQGFTTRIEPRPFYGATVTLEEGVRVIRPLPPERQVIINPGNATPLTLGFNETHVYENRTIRNYNYNEGGSSTSGGSGYRGRAGFYGPSFAPGGYSRLGGNGGGGQGHGGGHAHGNTHGGGHH